MPHLFDGLSFMILVVTIKQWRRYDSLSVALLVLSIVSSSSSKYVNASSSSNVYFSYDSTSNVGPSYWKDLQYDDPSENECGGSRNSPIAIETSSCDVYDDYEFDVSDSVMPFGLVSRKRRNSTRHFCCSIQPNTYLVPCHFLLLLYPISGW
jgi:hypothetical protein